VALTPVAKRVADPELAAPIGTYPKLHRIPTGEEKAVDY